MTEKVGLRVYVEEETADVIASLKEASRETNEIFDMSTSEAAREILNHGIETLGEKSALEELVDDVDVEVWQKQKEQNRLMKKGRVKDMVGGWRGRARSRLNARLTGPEPYPPEIAADLAESYFEELKVWGEDVIDDEQIAESREWLDDLMGSYRDAYRAKDVVPDAAFASVDDVETGADLLRLRDRFGELIHDVGEVAGRNASPDAVYRRIAGDYAVRPETVELVVEELTGDDVDARRALKSGEGLLDAVDPEALEAWGGDTAPLEAREPEELDGPTLEHDHEPEELARDEVIAHATDMLRSGADEEDVVTELRGIARSATEREAALMAARARLDVDGSDPAPIPADGRPADD